MAEIRPLDPNLRQQIAAMLSGDAKAGSVRANLVRDLLGSQTGDDSGLVGMTPLGAAFDVDAANRDQRQGGSGLGHTISAAAGMIPGAGPGAKAAEEAGVEALAKLGIHFDPSTETHALEGLPHHFIFEGDKGFHWAEGNPQSMEIKTSSSAHPSVEEAYQALQDHLSNAPSGKRVRDQLAAASKDDDKGATVIEPKSPPSVTGTKTALGDATKPAKVDPMKAIREAPTDHADSAKRDADVLHMEEVAGGDPKKLNFIKNAMDDEGGNSPEDVAMTLLQHMAEKDPEKFNALHDLVDPEGKDPDLALNHLINNHSIPEMLAMHYDLNPEQMSKAYAIQPPLSRNRPTQ